MTTKKLVPRASGEGAMGVTDNVWGEAYYDTGNFNKGLFVKGSGIEDVIANTVTQGGLGGEWTRNGLDIYYNGGNVGIGVSNPSEPLRVSSVGPDGRIMGFANSGGAKLNARLMSHDNGSNYVDTKISFDMVSTDGTAHEPALTLKAGGNVGIGTTNPGVKLHLAGDASSIIRLENTDLAIPTDRIIGGLEFEKKDPSGAGAGVVGGLRMHSADLHGQSTYLALSTTSIASLDQEAMRIDSNGNVGIGTTNPSAQLELYDPTGVVGIRIKSVNTETSYVDFADTDDDNPGSIAYNHPTNAMTFKTSDSEKMRISSGGNVGIGTTNPATSLDINKGIGEASPIITLSRGGVGKSRFAIANATDSILDGALTDDLCIRTEGGNIRFGTASATKTDMSILSSGNVGIGTTSPTNALSVIRSSTLGVPAAWIHNSNNSAAGNFGTVVSCISNLPATNVFQVRSNNSTHTNGNGLLTVKGDGKVGIGTTSPECPLMIKADPSNDSMFKMLDERAYVANENRAGISFQGLDSGGNRTAFCGISAYGASGGRGGLRFSSRSSANATTTGIVLNEEGKVGIGTTSPGAQLDVVGRVHFSKIPCINNTVPASLFTGAAMSFEPASSTFGTGKSKDIGIAFQSLHGAGGTGVGETDLLLGSINPLGSNQEIMKLHSDGRVRIGRNSSENSQAGQQFYGALLPGGSLEIRAEQDTNAATAQLRIVGGSGLNNLNGGQAVTGSLYIDNGGQASTVGKFKISQDIIGGEIHVVSANNGVKLTSGATSWVAASDETLKENIKPLENVLDKIKDYRCVEYNLKNSPEDKKIGFIAQDWVDDFNPIVNKDEEDVLGMKYTETIPVLLKAIQEQQQLIEDLKSRIETLENK